MDPRLHRRALSFGVSRMSSSDTDLFVSAWQHATSLNRGAELAADLSRTLVGIQARLEALEHVHLMEGVAPPERMRELETDLADATRRSIRLAERGDFRCFEVTTALCERVWHLRLGAAA
jgi:hypothetical protein